MYIEKLIWSNSCDYMTELFIILKENETAQFGCILNMVSLIPAHSEGGQQPRLFTCSQFLHDYIARRWHSRRHSRNYSLVLLHPTSSCKAPLAFYLVFHAITRAYSGDRDEVTSGNLDGLRPQIIARQLNGTEMHLPWHNIRSAATNARAIPTIRWFLFRR